MSLPDYFIIKDCTIRYEDNTLASDSQSLKRLVRGRTGQRWGITLELMLRPEHSLAGFAWLNKRKATAFTLALPGWTGKGPTSATLAASNTPGNGALQVTNAAGILPGMFFTTHASAKVHQVEAVTGNTLSIVPDLTTAVSSGLSIFFAGAEFTVFIASDVPEMRNESLRVPSQLTVDFVEAVA